MLLLSCNGLSRGFDAGPLFEDLGFELFPRRAGRFASRRTAPAKPPSCEFSPGWTNPTPARSGCTPGPGPVCFARPTSFLPGQTLFDEAKSALNDLLAAQEDLVHTAERLAASTDESERKALAARFDRLTELLHNEDAYTIDHKVEQVLQGIGFQAADFDRAVASFSGGQQRRLLLAKLLLSAPDVMLLDEPSNHLDIDATRWLESYLVKQPQAMLIVSHDRYFLNRVVTKVFELHRQDIRSFPGNYRAYVRQRNRNATSRKLKAWEAQKEYIEKQEEYIRRVHYGQLAKQAQSRQKALDRLERVERPTHDRGAADALRPGPPGRRRSDRCGPREQGLRIAAVHGLELRAAHAANGLESWVRTAAARPPCSVSFSATKSRIRARFIAAT